MEQNQGMRVWKVVGVVLMGALGLGLPGVACACEGLPGPCVGGRFVPRVRWLDPRRGEQGAGRSLKITEDTAGFWFFQPSNLDLVVKVLDARSVNEHAWIFFIGLTDTAVELTVTDARSGIARRYTNSGLSVPGAQDTRAFEARLLEEDLSSTRLLWIAAHPDDEILLAPWLAELCLRRGASCTFLVATRGEAGVCRLPRGCGGDLGAVREEEMRSAAALYGAQLTQWRLPDGSAASAEGVLEAWSLAAGGKEALLDELSAAIATVSPDWVVTFDPRHGSTCHPDHRALGALVLEALARLGREQDGWLLASRALFAEGLPAGFSEAATGPGGGPPSRQLLFEPSGDAAWEVLLENARRHPSQLSPEALASLVEVAGERRTVFLLDLAEAGSPEAGGACTLPVEAPLGGR